LSGLARAGSAPRADKFSAFAAERDAFIEVCSATGMHRQKANQFSRHPLAFLVEAADDFCYGIIDLEDGLEMELLHWDEVYPLLRPVLPDSEEVRNLLRSDLRPGRKAALLRGKIIEHFIEAGVQAFMQHHDQLLAGDVAVDLIALCAHPIREVVEGAKQLAKTRVFEHPRKIELEIGAYQVIGTLLDSLIEAAVGYGRGGDSNFRHQRLINLIGEHTFPPQLASWPEAERRYQCMLRAVDFISGMTDNYATYLAKQFSGMAEIRY
ncbi:MAG TPA: deoxyguanosinetriphosphate triphosphohydrolase, partial [Spongiibacteraceae bacterium]|nr:deoxyguanosinetriphosphate triphosphohydrolase [Spongiibacteraceae bacterium]